jgi:hypothetical protein
VLVLAALAALLAPRPLRQLGRAGAGLYAAVVGAQSAVLAARRSPRLAAGLPAVYATLHLSWGLGFLVGLVRFGGLPGLVRTLLSRLR